MSDSPITDRSGQLAQGTLGWLALGLVLLSAVARGGNTPLVWTFLAFAVLVLFGAQVALDFWRGVGVQGGRVWPVATLYFATLAYLWVQVVVPVGGGLAHSVWQIAPEGAVPRIGADPGQGRHVILRLICYAMVFWIVLRAAMDRVRAKRMLVAIALWSTLLALYGIYAYVAGDNPILGDRATRNLSATFVNRNNYATYAVFGVLANLAVYLDRTMALRGADGRVGLRDFLESFFGGGWVFLLGALICLGALAMTASRAGGIAGAIGLLAFLAARRQRGAEGGWILWAVVGAGIAFIAVTTTSGLLDRLITTDTEELRFVIYPEVWAGALERPLLGHGAGAFHDTFRARVPEGAGIAEWDMAHNSYLENAYEFGLPAAAAFYAALGLIAARLVRGARTRRRDTDIAAFAIGCLAAGAFHAAFDFSLQMPAAAALFAAILGLGWAQSFTREEIDPARARRRGKRHRRSDPQRAEGQVAAQRVSRA